MEKKCSTISIEVKKSQHRYVIGPRGNSINEILADTGVFVEMPANTTDSETITLRGPQEKLGLALTKVYEKAKTELESQAGALISTMAFAEVKVDAKYHKHIIGKGGSTINKIKSETDVTINIPDTDSGVTVIRIEGNKAGVDKASKELHGMVEKMENEKEKDLIIENRFH